METTQIIEKIRKNENLQFRTGDGYTLKNVDGIVEVYEGQKIVMTTDSLPEEIVGRWIEVDLEEEEVREELRLFILGNEELLKAYLLGQYGETIYFVGNEDEELHFVKLGQGTKIKDFLGWVNCPGLSNQDTSDFFEYWTEIKDGCYVAIYEPDRKAIEELGGDPDDITPEIAVQITIKNGDMASYYEDIIANIEME